MTLAYAVTFEFDERAPVTLRGAIQGSQVATCVSRATRQAQKDAKVRGWSSVVVVLDKRAEGDRKAAEA